MVPLARILAHDFDVLRPRSTGSRKKHQAADALPRGRLAVIPGAAHAIDFGAPLELSRIVRSLARHIGCLTSTLMAHLNAEWSSNAGRAESRLVPSRRSMPLDRRVRSRCTVPIRHAPAGPDVAPARDLRALDRLQPRAPEGRPARPTSRCSRDESHSRFLALVMQPWASQCTFLQGALNRAPRTSMAMPGRPRDEGTPAPSHAGRIP